MAEIGVTVPFDTILLSIFKFLECFSKDLYPNASIKNKTTRLGFGYFPPKQSALRIFSEFSPSKRLKTVGMIWEKEYRLYRGMVILLFGIVVKRDNALLFSTFKFNNH